MYGQKEEEKDQEQNDNQIKDEEKVNKEEVNRKEIWDDHINIKDHQIVPYSADIKRLKF